MKKVRTGIWVVLLLCAVASHVLAQETQPAAERPERSIVLSVRDGAEIVFGRAVPLQICYRNDGKTAWALADTPDKSVSVHLYYDLPGVRTLPQGYRFASMIHDHIKMPNGETWGVWQVPPKKPIAVAPGKTYEFSHEWERGWSGDVLPGRWVLWIDDEMANGKEKLLSNRIEIPLRFTGESMTTCLAIARDKEQSVYKRKWHGQWLLKIMPTLQLTWWYEDATSREKKKGEEEILRSLKAFEDFINDKNNAEAIEKAIQAINREAGLEPEEPRATSQPTSQSPPASRPAGVLR